MAGIGKYTVDSILKSDLLFVLVNLAADLMYAYLDPRIKYASKKDG